MTTNLRHLILLAAGAVAFMAMAGDGPTTCAMARA